MSERGKLRALRGTIAVLAAILVLPLFATGTPGMRGDTPAATYSSGIPFELTGTGDSYDAEGEPVPGQRDFEERLSWVGTFRLTVSDPIVYESARDAGISAIEENSRSDYRVVVVDMTLENVDAAGRDRMAGPEGGSFILLTMFRLSSEGLYCDWAGFSAPPVEGLAISAYKDPAEFTWVAPGKAAHVRIAYHVIGGIDEPEGGYDAASLDVGYRLLIDSGDADQARSVDLGPAAAAEGGDER